MPQTRDYIIITLDLWHSKIHEMSSFRYLNEATNSEKVPAGTVELKGKGVKV